MNENQADIKIVGGLNLESTEALIRQQLAQIQNKINSSGGIELKLKISKSSVDDVVKTIRAEVSSAFDGGASQSSAYTEATKKQTKAREDDAAAARRQAAEQVVLANGLREIQQIIRKLNGDADKFGLEGIIGDTDEFIDQVEVMESGARKMQQAIFSLQKLMANNYGVISGDEDTTNKFKDLFGEIIAGDIDASVLKQRVAALAQEVSIRKTINRELKSQQKTTEQIAAEEQQVYYLISKIARENPKLRSNAMFSQQYDTIVSQFTAGNISPEEASRQLVQLQKNLQAAGLAGKTFSQTFENALNKFAQYISVSTIILSLMSGLRTLVQNVIELDSAMVDLQIASGMTKNEVRNLINEYHELGQELGATTIEVAKSADTWLRQGYSIDEANELIADSMMLSKLGQIEADEAAKALTSSMKGYGVAVEDATSIVDKFTAVDMAAATSAGDIATAMAETAVGADVAGVSMDRLVGYITQVAEVTQDAPESVGTFFRTLFARMGNIKAGRLIDPETEEDLSDVEATLNGMGIQLRDSNEEFRNFAEVLDEVAAKWDTMSSVQQRAIAVSFAGTRQQEKFLVLMEGYDQAMEYAAISTDSAGTATEKYGVYLDSIEAKMNALKSSTYNLADTVFNSDDVGNVVEAGTAIVNAITRVVDAIGALPAAGLAVGLGVFVKNFSKMRAEAQTMANSINALKRLTENDSKNWNDSAAAITSVATSLGGLNERQQRYVLSHAKLNDAQRGTIALIQRGISADKALVLASKGVIDSTGALTVGFDDFKKALNGVYDDKQAREIYDLVNAQDALNASASKTQGIFGRLKSMGPFGWIEVGITLYSIIAGIIDGVNQAHAELLANTAESAEALQSEFDTLDEQVSKMQELQNSIESGNLSIEESANARAELMGIQDEIITKYGVERDAIDGVTDSYLKQAAAIKQAAAEEWLAGNYEGYQAAEDYVYEEIGRAPTSSLSSSDEANKIVTDAIKQVTGMDATMTSNNIIGHLVGTRSEVKAQAEEIFSIIQDAREKYANSIDADPGVVRFLDNTLSTYSNVVKSFNEDQNFINSLATMESGTANIIAASKEYTALLNQIENVEPASIVDEEQFDIAQDKLVELRDKAEDIQQVGVRDAFLEEIDSLQSELDSKEFEVKIKPEILESNDSYAADARFSLRSASSFLGDLNAEELRTLTQGVDLYGAGYDEYSKKYQTGLNMLAKTAERYNITIEEAIDLMVELGLVTEETAEETAEEFKDASDNIGESFAGSIQKIVSEGGDSLSQFQDAVDTALDWRSTTEEIQNALDVLEELSGIKIDPTSDDANDQLLLLQYYANGATESFYDLLDSELDALGIDISVDGIVGGIQEIINMAGNGVQSAATLLEILKALGAVTVTTKDNAYDTSDGHLLGIQTMNRIASGEIPRIEVTYTPNLEWAERLGNETRRLKDNGGGRRSSSSSSEREDTTDYWLEEYKALVAELDHQRNMDYISEQQYYDRLRELADKYLKDREQYIDEYRSVQEELWDYQKRMYEEQRDAAIEAAEAEYDAKIEALEAEQDAAEEALRNQIDLLDQELDAYRELIDERKRLLDDAANEREHDQRVEELNEEIANIQSELDAIALDDSAKANAQRVELKEQLLDAQKELEDEQYNWSVDTQKDALDKEYERYEKLVNDQQALLEQQINNLNLYYEQQIQMMGTMKDQMIASINAAFDQLLINVQTSLQETVIEVEEAAQQIESIFSRIYDTTTKTGVKELQAALVNQGYDIGNYGPNKDGIDGIIGKKTNKALVMAWQEYLNSLGANLNVDGIRGTKTKAAEKQFGVVYPYHTGGVVGKDVSGVDSDVLRNIVPLDDNEVLAKLLNNELVLTEAQQEQVRGTFNRITDQFKSVADAKYGMANSIVTNNSPTVNVSNVFNGEVNSDTVRQLENWARKFKDDIKNNVFGTMNKHNVFSSKIPVRSY